MAAKRPALPLVLSANDLIGGEVVYFAEGGWSPSIAEALVARDEPGALRLEQALAETIAADSYVDPYLHGVVTGPRGEIVPGHYRDRIRSGGPTIPYGAEASHVPL